MRQRDCKRTIKCLQCQLKVQQQILKKAQTQRNVYKQAYEEMEVRYKELLNNQG